MKKIFQSIIITAFASIAINVEIFAQADQLSRSQQFRLADRIIRIAEPGEFADSVNVWGDVGSSGRYLVPKNTPLNKLITYALGPRTLRDGQTNLDWSKMRVEVFVHDFDTENNKSLITEFKYRLEESFPAGMYSYTVTNNQTITVRVKRRPSFRDYLGVFASTISAVASTVILLDRLNNR